MDYAKAFRVLRAAFGLQQSQLAERLSIGASQLSLIENGKRQPSLKTVDDFARALGVPKALVVLLASETKELDGQGQPEIEDLARALLRLLVTASDKQLPLPFGKKDI